MYTYIYIYIHIYYTHYLELISLIKMIFEIRQIKQEIYSSIKAYHKNFLSELTGNFDTNIIDNSDAATTIIRSSPSNGYFHVF